MRSKCAGYNDEHECLGESPQSHSASNDDGIPGKLSWAPSEFQDFRTRLFLMSFAKA